MKTDHDSELKLNICELKLKYIKNLFKTTLHKLQKNRIRANELGKPKLSSACLHELEVNTNSCSLK